METAKRSAVNHPANAKLASFVKLLHIRAPTGVSPLDRNDAVDEDLQKREALELEALLAQQFAAISSLKAAYAQLQFSQSPYDSDQIQAADEIVVSELNQLSQLKQCYAKKQFDSSPKKALILAETQEQKSLVKMCQIMGKKMESQINLKQTQITILKNKLEKANVHNKLLHKVLLSSPSHFNDVLGSAIKSTRSFSRLMFEEMKSRNWELDKVAHAIHPDVVYWNPNDTCFSFESLIFSQMFSDFNYPFFRLSKDTEASIFLKKFNELKSAKPMEFLSQKPQSTFGEFCRHKYLRVVQPKVEQSFFGNVNHRELVNLGKFPETKFFAAFSEMCKRVWLVHCFAYSMEPKASIFEAAKGDRFSETYMKSVAEETFLSPENSPDSYLGVAFTVVPGFQIGKTIFQSQVYLSLSPADAN